MAQVRFKQGLQQTINSIKTNSTPVTEGAFYLTTDTNRLYFAKSSAASDLVELNQFIHILDGNSLPTKSTGVEEGDIYYIRGLNALAIYKNGSWVQMNPDTYLATANNGLTATAGNSKQAILNLLVRDSKENPDEVTGHVTVEGGANVNVEVSNGKIVISSTDTNDNTTYTMSAESDNAGAILRLSEDGASPAHNQDVLIRGTDGVSVEKDSTSGDILIKGSVPINGVANTFSPTGGLVTTLSTEDDNIQSTPIIPTISYGAVDGATRSTAVFVQGQTGNPTAALDVYTADEVDTLINDRLASFDAMSYKGTIANEAAAISAFTATGANKPVAGDTYKAANTFTFSDGASVPGELQGATINTGDLLIASGTDNNISWDIVPSGDDQFISVSTNANNKSFAIHDGRTSVNSDIGGIIFHEDDTTGNSIIGLTTTVNGGNLHVTPVHGAAGTGTAVTVPAVASATTQNTKGSLDIPVITGISKDTHGHITAVSAATYRIVDTHGVLSNFTTNNDLTGNVGTYQLAIGIDSDEAKMARFILTSDNLKITQATDNGNKGFKVNLEWESFENA